MDAERLLTVLVEAEVDFIVIGGVGAVLQGVPTTTFDVDIVPSLEPSNVDRLVAALEELEACYREHLPRRLRPTARDLSAGGHALMMTSAGPLDVLGHVTGDLGYEDLLGRSFELDLGGTAVRVLDLAVLIEIKERTGRDKDLAQLPLLRRTLEERRQGPSGSGDAGSS